MIIRDSTPEKILVNVDQLNSSVSTDKTRADAEKKHENSKNILLAVLGGITSCLLSLIPSWAALSIGIKIVLLLFTAVYLIALIWFLFQYKDSQNKLNELQNQALDVQIIDEAKKKLRYTALLIICYQKPKTGEVKFMTEKQGNYLIHCDMDPNKSAHDQKDLIINYLATSYSIPKAQISSVIPFSEEPFFSIKPIHETETQNGFIFFQIKLKLKTKQNLLNHSLASWKTIQEMRDLPKLMGRNQDIVTALTNNITKVSDSFDDLYGPMHIIWNITKKCSYQCAICATRDDSREELNTNAKLRVLNHIVSAREKIDMLDFAGGDPMFVGDIRTVILNAINSLGEEHVSVTTTGKGIQEAEKSSEEEIAKLLKRCEITIDASHENLAHGAVQSIFPRNSPEYCNDNLLQIKSTAEFLQHLTVNIPILDHDLNNEEIDTIISMLRKIKNEYPEIQIETQILRLMPVGQLNCTIDAQKYKEYNPIPLIKTIKQRIESIDIPCRLHCSLRVLPELEICDMRCNMLDKKIGIDCSGNVFACTWGAYLHPSNMDIRQNPFYLGNLTSSSLKNILRGQDSKTSAFKRISRDIQNQVEKPYCEAVSWFFKKTSEENNDPLSQNNSN